MDKTLPSNDIFDLLFKQTKIEYLRTLENTSTDYIIDVNDNMILPNLKLVEPSESIYLREDIFSKYLDKIIVDSFQHYGNKICLLKSVFYTDYFITIDFVDFLYKIPNILLTSINKCKNNPSIRFYVIPIRLNLTYKDAHSNVVIVDNLYKTIEFFEPHGSVFRGFHVPKPYNIENHIKILLSRLFPIRSKLYIYKNVQNSCPIGLQGQQSLINPGSGHCLAWSLLFINTRINNLYFSPEYIINYFNHHFSPVDLDIYMKRYISLLEQTTHNINTKTLPNFKYHLNLSPDEKIHISNRIQSLTQQYLLELTHEKDKSMIDKIFEELISYHKFQYFNDIFFKTVNEFMEEFKSDIDVDSDTEASYHSTEEEIIPTKRKLSDSYDIFDDKKAKTSEELSPLSLLFKEMDQNTLDEKNKEEKPYIDTTTVRDNNFDKESNVESSKSDTSDTSDKSDTESEFNMYESDEEELRDLYNTFA
jgi:hypothetical protein